MKVSLVDITGSVTLNGRRRQKNIVSIAYNLVAWCMDVLGDMPAFLVKRWAPLDFVDQRLWTKCVVIKVGLSPGHEPGDHLQLWPECRDLPDRGPGLPHPGQQLQGEELRAVHRVCAQRREEQVSRLKSKINLIHRVCLGDASGIPEIRIFGSD